MIRCGRVHDSDMIKFRTVEHEYSDTTNDTMHIMYDAQHFPPDPHDNKLLLYILYITVFVPKSSLSPQISDITVKRY